MLHGTPGVWGRFGLRLVVPHAVQSLNERLHITTVEHAVGDKSGEHHLIRLGVLFGDTPRTFDERASGLGEVIYNQKML